MSPLFGETAETLKARDTSLRLTPEGRRRIDGANDAARAHIVGQCDQTFWHHRFVDIMSEQDGASHIDYSPHFDEIVLVDERSLPARACGFKRR